MINVGRNVLPQYELIMLQISCVEGNYLYNTTQTLR